MAFRLPFEGAVERKRGRQIAALHYEKMRCDCGRPMVAPTQCNFSNVGAAFRRPQKFAQTHGVSKPPPYLKNTSQKVWADIIHPQNFTASLTFTELNYAPYGAYGTSSRRPLHIILTKRVDASTDPYNYLFSYSKNFSIAFATPQLRFESVT